MKLRNPYFMEDMGLDQPYLSMKLIAPYCDFSCKGCQNIHLKNNDTKDFSIDDLVSIYKDNPFYQGLTIGGLEPFIKKSDTIAYDGCEHFPRFDLSDSFLYDVRNFIKSCNIEKVTVYTRFDLRYRNVSSYIQCIKNLDCVKELYLKTGAYIIDMKEKEIKINNWNIILASNNQDFIRVK